VSFEKLVPNSLHGVRLRHTLTVVNLESRCRISKFLSSEHFNPPGSSAVQQVVVEDWS